MTAGAQLKIAPLSPVSCGSMVCRMDGARTVVVAVKATFSLHHERLAELVRPDKVVVADRFGDNPEAGSHFAARELVPSLPRPGAIVYGHARAPAGAWVVSQAVRFCVYRPDRSLCDKRIVVVGDRSPQGTPRPWNVLPLVHERAFGGPGFPQNPLGTGASEGSRVPNLIDPSDPRRPACFAPIPPGWPARLQHLRGWDIRALDQPIVEIPRGFSAEYFHPAPADQRFDALRGDEWILLEGMVQDHPRFTSRLPSAQVQGRLHRRTPRGWVFEEPFTMGADMLVVDADRQTASLVFRGWIPLDRDDALQGACLYVGLAQADDPITWPDADDLATPTDESSDQTRTISLSAIRAGLEKRVAPFEISPPSASAASSAPIPGAPWAPHAPAPTVTPVHDATSTLPPQGLRVFGVEEEEPTLGETAPMPAMGRAKPAATLPFAGTPEPKPPVSRAEPSTSALPFVPGPPQPFATAPEPPAMVASLEPPALVVSPELPAMVVSLEPPAMVVSPEPPPMVASLEPPALVVSPEPPAMVSTPEPPPLVTALPALSRPPWALNARPLAYAPPPAEPPPAPPAKVLSAAPEQALSEPAAAGAEPGEQAPSEPAAAGAESPALPLSEPPRQALSEPAPAGAEPPALPLSEPPAKALSEPPAAGAAPPKSPADGGAQTLRDILLDRLKNERSIADLPFEFSDLAGLDLASVNLAGVRLRGAILRGTNLTGARLTGADLTGADLSGATLRDAVADTADLTRANLEGADFTGASLIDANLTSCHGAKVDFTSALLSGADLRQARLSGARLDGADLRKATCAKADLSGASLVRADLTDAVLRSCRLKGADLTMVKLGATDLRDADLDQANLTGVDRSRAKLAGASLKGVVEEPSE